MKIVLDMQGAQAAGRIRGVGRYTLNLTEAMVRQAGSHEILLALNGSFSETIEPLRAAFAGLLPPEAVRVWSAPGPTGFEEPGNAWRREVAERLHEAFMAALAADVVHWNAVFEGYADAAVTGFGHFADAPPAGVILYDLTPLLMPETYLTDDRVASWYRRKLQLLRRADLLLAISEATRRDGIELLGLPADRVVTIFAAADDRFRPIDLPPERLEELRRRYGLDRPFVLCVGGVDPHKNVDGLIQAFHRLPPEIRSRHQLLLVGPAYPVAAKALTAVAAGLGMTHRDVNFAGIVSDDDLVALYNTCTVAICPSMREGFGLPLLEAMACGAPAIAADSSSLPEVIGRADALFDPRSREDMARKLYAVLADDGFRTELRAYGLKRSKAFSWDETARRTIAAYESLHARESRMPRSRAFAVTPGCRRLAYVAPWPMMPGCRDILCALAQHYEIDIVLDDQSAVDQPGFAGFAIRSMSWFDAQASRYDRILYDIGTAQSCRQIPVLLARHPGAGILREFFLGGLFAALEQGGTAPHALTRALYHAHGFHAVRARTDAQDPETLLAHYPCSLGLMQQALGIIVHADEPRRQAMAWHGVEAARDWTQVSADMSVEDAAGAYAAAIECAYAGAGSSVALSKSIAALAPAPREEAAWINVATAMAANAAARYTPRQLLIDVSVQAMGIQGSGITRVVRKIVGELLVNPPAGYRVEPVYALPGAPYRYARRFALAMLGSPEESLEDEVVEIHPGDCFLGLDLAHGAPAVAGFYRRLRDLGGRVFFVVYDLLPLLRADWFPPGVADAHGAWFRTIAQSDGLLCISRTVADEVLAELDRLTPERHLPLRLGWFHLGSDISSANVVDRSPAVIEEQLAQLRQRPSIMMVGIFYPRKGHAQTLAAFEHLWSGGQDVNLVIVGRDGWGLYGFPERLRRHPEAGHRLFWFEGPDDADLCRLYQTVDGVLMPTEGEGFGLPLMEAAHYAVPILARDIPVFREIAGDSIEYFCGLTPKDLAVAIKPWLTALVAGTARRPSGIRRQSWAQAARQVAEFVTTQESYRIWPTGPDPGGLVRTGASFRAASSPR